MKKICLVLLPAALLAASCAKGDYSAYPSWGDSQRDASYPADPGGIGETPGTGDRFSPIRENPFMDVAEAPVSTFSVDADGASYAYMRRCITEGWMPQPDAVRIEEFLNYFPFDYPSPEGGESVSLNAEVGVCPWSPEHRLLRLGIKGRDIPKGQEPRANFVFLIDVSGSMSSADKLDLLKQGLISMLDYMHPDDRVAIVTYASGEKLALPSTPVSEKATIVPVIRKLAASGATSGARAMEMAYEEVLKNFDKEANNRVIMGTDGDFNVGVTSTDALVEMVQNYAARGVYLTVCGFGMGNLNDSMMEQISNKGNGTYEYIDSELEMAKVFVNERARFVSIANDCKVQITFNPEVVSKYRLIGYENRVMANEDFENDEKDAAEIGAGQTVTALYELVPAVAEASGEPLRWATFDFRYKEALGGESKPLSLDVLSLGEDVSDNLDFAAGLAAYGLTLRKSEYQGGATLSMSRELVDGALAFDPYGLRAQLSELLRTAESLMD